MLAPSRTLRHERDVLLVLSGSPRVDELDHHPRLILRQGAGMLEKLEIEIDPILLDVQPPVAWISRSHDLKLPLNRTQPPLGAPPHRLRPTIFDGDTPTFFDGA
jgi:hypothetical protein